MKMMADQDTSQLAMEGVIEALETMLDGGMKDGMVFIYIPAAHAASEEDEDKKGDEYEQTPALKQKGKGPYDQFHLEEIFSGGLSPGGSGSPLTVTQI